MELILDEALFLALRTAIKFWKSGRALTDKIGQGCFSICLVFTSFYDSFVLRLSKLFCFSFLFSVLCNTKCK